MNGGHSNLLCHKHGGHHGYADVLGQSVGRLLWASALNVSFAIVEFVGGLASNSLALISDAVHNLADAVSILIAFIARRMGQKVPTERYTFGFRRFEILSALFNAVVLIVIYGFIFVKAFGRLHSHGGVDSRSMLIIAIIGMVAKFVSLLILHRPSRGNLNVRAAYMHLLADLLSSFSVIIGGLAIHFWRVAWVDSVITYGVGFYILLHTWPILRECVRILMQAAPRGINVAAIVSDVAREEGIDAVTDAHLWLLAEEDVYFSARVALRSSLNVAHASALLGRVERSIADRYGINHVSLALGSGSAAEGVSNEGCCCD